MYFIFFFQMSAMSMNCIPFFRAILLYLYFFSFYIFLISPCYAVNFSYYNINLIQNEGRKRLYVPLNFLKGNIISHSLIGD